MIDGSETAIVPARRGRWRLTLRGSHLVQFQHRDHWAAELPAHPSQKQEAMASV